MRTIARAGHTVTSLLPRGRTLPREAWGRRHRALLWLLWAHVLVLPLFALSRGLGPVKALGWVVPIAVAGLVGELPTVDRRVRSVAVVLGLLTASAVLVGEWNGQIEAHFHFFVMISVLALYEDWVPFGVAVAYVVFEHGVLGAISPRLVYSHGGNPWIWALIHGGFVLGAVAASVVLWRLNEDMRSDMEAAQRREQAAAARFRLAFETSVAGIALVAPDGQFLSVNTALCTMVGYPEELLLRQTFQSITHPDDLGASAEQQVALLAGTIDVYEAEKRYIHRKGHVVWVRLGVSAVRDASGQVDYFISQFNDVTERRRVEEELAHRALHDQLTGLPNRALLHDRVHHALLRARRHCEKVALIFVDIDHFKLVNDGMGHAAGDYVLVATAERLTATVRAEDTVARFGGDEFTILCDNTSEDAAQTLAKRVIAAFDAPFEFGGREFHLRVSLGIRVADTTTIDSEELMRDADGALYAAKEHGRDRYELFDPNAARKPDALATAEALRQAVRENELRLHYQPTVDLGTGRITGVEALLRWEHPDQGMVPPGDFIPTAEETGLIIPIGEWVLNSACAQLAAWRAAGTVEDGFRMAVNVSGRQLSRPEFPGVVAKALAISGIPGRALCLEITESAVIENPVTGLANLFAVKEQGVWIALDDFGVGFSSLSQIRDLPPVDVIKVDRSFTAGLGDNESDTAVITAVMSLARSLQLAVVAEGVEGVHQIDRLSALGCEVGQGFYFARPLPAEEVGEVLARGTISWSPAPEPAPRPTAPAVG